jgi:glyoxylase-like metal-dependent hydrolase (beta-lactamase superfamily II)
LIVATRGHHDFDTFMEHAEANLESTRAAHQAAPDEDERRQLAAWIDYNRSLLEAKPIRQVRPPNVTFDQRMAFHGRDRSAELIAFPSGHSPSDAVLFLPQERIAFMSDLLSIAHHSWVGAGDASFLSTCTSCISVGWKSRRMFRRKSGSSCPTPAIGL